MLAIPAVVLPAVATCSCVSLCLSTFSPCEVFTFQTSCGSVVVWFVVCTPLYVVVACCDLSPPAYVVIVLRVSAHLPCVSTVFLCPFPLIRVSVLSRYGMASCGCSCGVR